MSEGAVAAHDVEIHVGQVWEDMDFRSFYEVTPAGDLLPHGYVGLVEVAPRRVRIVEVGVDRVRVRALHNNREASIQRKSFFASPKNSRGRRRSQGFVLYEGDCDDAAECIVCGTEVALDQSVSTPNGEVCPDCYYAGEDEVA